MSARRRFGQHFLDASWASRVLESAAFAPPDHVIEIGPGRGALTIPLSRTVAALTSIAVEWPDAQVLVVTHGGIIDAAWRAVNGVALSAKREFELHNASIHKLPWSGRG